MQPDPFRRYDGAPLIALPHDRPSAAPSDSSREGHFPAAFDLASVGSFLRHSMGLSAWKAYRESRWALRVNPSSGNLHPTEAYVVHEGQVFHYCPREHAIEERAVVAPGAWQRFLGGQPGMLVALTSIYWREAWKYGERAFRYCQHDIGHAIAALRVAASLLGWRVRLLPEWSDDQIAELLGIDRQQDREDGAEQEHPACIALVSRDDASLVGEPEALVNAVRSAEWRGRANVLSQGHVDWPVIDRVAAATRFPGLPTAAIPVPSSAVPLYSPATILQRRSAVAFDGRSTLGRDQFVAMLSTLQPGSPPFDAIDWPPHVHLVLFVHRIDGLAPGVYVYLRDAAVLEEWRSSIRPEFLWEPISADTSGGLFLLLPSEVTWPAMRISCDQDIAGAGFFSLGMIARLASSVRDRGEWFYRRLFWECGIIGQVLYLEAEKAGVRGTGIGCFYDDAVHEILQLRDAEWQSLYHFAMGMPVEDARLTSEPGYEWESARL